MFTPPPQPMQPGGNQGGANAPPTQTPSMIVAPLPPIVPTAPQMGTVEETTPRSYAYAFGGKPLPDFSALDDPTSRKLRDTMYRPLDPTSDGKNGKAREKGLEVKLKEKGDIAKFRRDIMKHLEKHGLDTITYLQHPLDPTQVHSVVTHYALFNTDLQTTKKLAEDFESKFDKWDMKNDASAKDFLTNSIDSEFYDEMYLSLDPDESFTMTWIRIMQYMITTSSDRFNDMKLKIKALRPQQYSGQNITLMINDFMRLADELEHAAEYEHHLTQEMVNGCLHVTDGGDVMGKFKYTLQKLSADLDDAILATKFMLKPQASAYFAARNLHFKQVLRKINLVYRHLNDSNKWEPSKLPADRSALSIVHQSKSSSYSKPPSSANKSKSRPNHQRTNKHSKGKSRFGGRDRTGWRFQAPKPNEPTTKTVNGDKFHWCTKCFGGAGFWTKTHTTATHTGSTPATSSSTNCVTIDPSFWSCITTKHSKSRRKPRRHAAPSVSLPFPVRSKQNNRWTHTIPAFTPPVPLPVKPLPVVPVSTPSSPASATLSPVQLLIAAFGYMAFIAVTMYHMHPSPLAVISTAASTLLSTLYSIDWFSLFYKICAPIFWTILGLCSAQVPVIAQVIPNFVNTSVSETVQRLPTRSTLRHFLRSGHKLHDSDHNPGFRRYKSSCALRKHPSPHVRTSHSLPLRRDKYHMTRPLLRLSRNNVIFAF